MKKLIKDITIRQNVIIYQGCGGDPDCVSEAWEKVTAEKRALDARHGDH